MNKHGFGVAETLMILTILTILTALILGLHSKMGPE